jgi:hypothetical protein
MKLFSCQHCGQIVYFDNTRCERCGHRLGFLPDAMAISALVPDGDLWSARAAPGRYRFCANAAHDVCNWLIPADQPDDHCLACRHNRMIPNLANADHVKAWRKLESAKHRLFYSLLRLGLPLGLGLDGPGETLIFDFLGDQPGGPKVLTGHDEGVITLAIAEADDAERESRRQAMGEAYRTLLGHFRHEVGHYFWDVLVQSEPDALHRFRALFGDERPDYNAALQAHYSQGAPPDWQANFVSAYATSHPWEDFAETFAHYLHIVDTLETAHAFGVRVMPQLDGRGDLSADIDFDPYGAGPFQRVIDSWLPVSLAMNSINEAMGQPDLYPFVLSPAVIEKLGYMHDLVHGAAARKTAAPLEAAA